MTDQHKPKLTEHEMERIIDRALGEFEQSDRHTRDDTELDSTELDNTLLDEMEHAAAQLDLSVAVSDPIEMPSGLADRIKARVSQYPPHQAASTEPPSALRYPGADAFSGHAADSSQRATQTKGAPAGWIPWMVAAASVLIATVSILMPRGGLSVPDTNADRIALIESTPPEQLIQWDWISTDDAAVVGEVIGDVVWSNTLKKGYMRISGLAVNDPSLEQYQLWIFDATRPTGALPQFGEGLLTQRPIDGGVFDVDSTGEIIIEIDAKLLVQQAAAFAVTVEPPGGVVVSDRSRVPLLALAP